MARFIPPWQFRQTPPPPREPAGELSQMALVEVLQADRDAREWDVRGEMLVPQRSEPARPAPQPLVIPRPDWDEEERERAAREAEAPEILEEDPKPGYPAGKQNESPR